MAQALMPSTRSLLCSYIKHSAMMSWIVAVAGKEVSLSCPCSRTHQSAAHEHVPCATYL